MEPCSAKASGEDFPYSSSLLCYTEVSQDGKVRQGLNKEGFERAKSGKSKGSQGVLIAASMSWMNAFVAASFLRSSKI